MIKQLLLLALATILFTSCGQDNCYHTDYTPCSSDSTFSLTLENQTDERIDTEARTCSRCGYKKGSVETQPDSTNTLNIDYTYRQSNYASESDLRHTIRFETDTQTCQIEVESNTPAATCDEDGCKTEEDICPWRLKPGQQ